MREAALIRWIASPIHARWGLVAVCLTAAGLFRGAVTFAEEPVRDDPAAWGGDHVGQPFPEYVTGDECLFCHREVGSTWNGNRHQLTIRPAPADDPAMQALSGLNDGIAGQTDFLMGSHRITRFLKRAPEYGTLQMLTASFVSGERENDGTIELRVPDENGSRNAASPDWDGKSFADRCAGCHCTAVDVKTREFSALSLDCFTCHGDVSLEHTKDVRRVFLSNENREPRQVISACGQCHLRGGRSKSSGLPYANTFVAEDNLFRDFQVDFSNVAIGKLPAADQHVFLSARDVVAFGQSEMDCLTCHDVHARSSRKHQQLSGAAICSSCHVGETDDGVLPDSLRPANQRRTHHPVCDY